MAVLATRKAEAKDQNRFFCEFVSGVASGIFIGFGCIFYCMSLCLTVIDEELRKVLGSALFSFGMMLVCICGTSLYTGKIGFALHGDSAADRIENAARLPFMLLGNVLGICILAAFVFASTRLLDNGLDTEMANVAVKKYEAGLEGFKVKLFLDAFCCGLLVYMAVLSYRKCGVSGLPALIVFIAIFVYCGFQHSIANCFYYTFYLLGKEAGSAEISNIIVAFLITVLGNTLGALSLDCLIKED